MRFVSSSNSYFYSSDSSVLGNLQDQTPDGTDGKCLFSHHGYVPDINNKSGIPCFNILVFCTAIPGGQQLYASGPIPLC